MAAVIRWCVRDGSRRNARELRGDNRRIMSSPSPGPNCRRALATVATRRRDKTLLAKAVLARVRADHPLQIEEIRLDTPDGRGWPPRPG